MVELNIINVIRGPCAQQVVLFDLSSRRGDQAAQDLLSLGAITILETCRARCALHRSLPLFLPPGFGKESRSVFGNSIRETRPAMPTVVREAKISFDKR